MAIVRVQSVFNSGSGTAPSVSFASPTTTGNFLYFAYGYGGNVSLADSPIYNDTSGLSGDGPSYTSLSCSLFSYFFGNITGRSGATITHASTAGTWVAVGIEYSSVRTSATILDVSSTDSFSAEASPQSSGTTGTTVQAREVAIGATLVTDNTLTITNDADFTSVGNQTNTGLKLQVADRIRSVIGTEEFGITYTGNATGVIGVSLWKDQNAGSGLIYLPLGMCG